MIVKDLQESGGVDFPQTTESQQLRRIIKKVKIIEKKLDFWGFVWYIVCMIKINKTQLTEREKILLAFVLKNKA